MAFYAATDQAAISLSEKLSKGAEMSTIRAIELLMLCGIFGAAFWQEAWRQEQKYDPPLTGLAAPTRRFTNSTILTLGLFMIALVVAKWLRFI